MLINSVIIILGEVLEASLLISLLLVITSVQNLTNKWLTAVVLPGFGGAVLYAANIQAISIWLDGSGQEIVNASMHYIVYFLLLLIIGMVLVNSRTPNITRQKYLAFFMGTAVGLAFVCEGSEIIIFVSGFMAASDLKGNILIGSIIGASIGCSIGVVFYFLLNDRKRDTALIAAIFLLSLVAAGMVSKATRLMVQADWLPSYPAVWDTSSWVAEESVLGQLLFALIGYESTPSFIEVVLYYSSLTLIGIACLAIYLKNKSPHANLQRV